MFDHKTRMWCAAFLVGLLSGCGGGENRKATFPVTGVVIVNGQPAEAVRITLNDVKGMDPNQPTYSETFSDKDGKFSVSTYEKGDGVPEGEYTLTFYWGTINPLNMQYGGEDKLKQKYTDPATSKIKVKVEKGKPTDMGRIELSTK